MHNIAEALPTRTGRRRTSTAARLAGLELLIVLAAELEPVIDLVAVPALATSEPIVLVGPELELPIVLVAVELGLPIDLAAVEPELLIVLVAPGLELPIVPVVVAVPGHLRTQLAVALRTRSVTAAHRRGLVPVLTAEDLAAAAETTREPAAAGAVIAWEVAE